MKKNDSFKKYLSNENGAALVLVLIVIALVMFFSTVIMNSILTQAKHNQVSETDYRAVHLAEMGAEFTQTKLSEYVQENDFDPSLEMFYFSDLFDVLERESSQFVVDDEYPDRGFVVTQDSRQNTSYEMTEDGAKVFVEITGKDGDREKDLYLTFNVRFANGGSGDGSVDDWERGSETFPELPSDPDPDTEYVDSDGKEYKNVWDLTTGDYYADGNIHIAQNSDITILGIGVFNEGMSFKGNPHTRVLVRDHAYFNKPLTWESNKHPTFIGCGSARFKNGLDYGAQFGVRQHFIADGPVYFDKERVYIGEDAIFYDGLYFNHNKGILEVGGNVTIYVDGDPRHYFDQHIKGKIEHVGDLTIHGNGDSITNPHGTKQISHLSNPTYAEPCDAYPLPEIEGGGNGDAGADLVDGEY